MRVFCFICALTLPTVLPAAPWIVVTEIHYHPPGSQGEASADEFIEIVNREPPRVDLTGWTTFEANGVVVCSFVPRLYDFHPDAVKIPYHHSNSDSDEVIFYDYIDPTRNFAKHSGAV